MLVIVPQLEQFIAVDADADVRGIEDIYYCFNRSFWEKYDKLIEKKSELNNPMP